VLYVSCALFGDRCQLTTVFQSLVVALVVGRLDYCNSILAVLPASLIRRLRSAQKAAAWLIFRIWRYDHVTHALISLNWLRVPERILLKIAVLTYQ